MSKMKNPGSSRQVELFARSLKATVEVDGNHRLVVATSEIDWTALEELVSEIRRRKLKNAAGRPPHLRALIGALLFRSMRHVTYREAEDLIRYYAPARYLCGLTETEWSPDANTIQDFEQLLGEEGMRQLNEQVVKWAVKEKLADPRILVADMTAQEAFIPYPNEMGLMTTFLTAVTVASKHVGGAVRDFVDKSKGLLHKAKQKIRAYRLFAKDKSKETKNQMVSKMVSLVENLQRGLSKALAQSRGGISKLRKHAKVARRRLDKLSDTMRTLVPHIRHWLKTGQVAANKLISLHVPELYSIVRGKVGKTVEFGISWGISRLRGGFLMATMGKDKRELTDSTFAVTAVTEHIKRFGKAPISYAYDRGGWSQGNAQEIKELGVKNVGLAPRGRASWKIKGRIKDMLVRERAQVEGGIGSLKARKYGFNKPNARSLDMMGVCGQRAVIGFNLTKLLRGVADKRNIAMVG